MNIRFYDGVSFEKQKPFEDIASFQYIENVPLTKSDKERSFQTFVKDVNDVFDGKYDGSNILDYPYTHFIGLPFKYRSILREGLKYPIYETPDPTSPMQKIGVGRELVLSHFFDSPKVDRVIYQSKPGGKLSNLVRRISNNSYWKGTKIHNMLILSSTGRMFPNNVYPMTIEFNSSTDHILGSWTGKIHDNGNSLWMKIKKMIFDFNGDYEKLLRDIVLYGN